MYYAEPSGGLVHQFSHIGGALQTPAFVPGSQYPSESGSFGDRENMGQKLYPMTEHHILGKPLFARTSSNIMGYTPPP
jgi:hypothetical protein